MITTTLLGLLGLVTRPFKHPKTLGVTKAKGVFELRHGELKEAALKLLDQGLDARGFNMKSTDEGCFYYQLKRFVPESKITQSWCGYEEFNMYFGCPDLKDEYGLGLGANLFGANVGGMKGVLSGILKTDYVYHCNYVLNFVKEQCTRNGWDYETL